MTYLEAKMLGVLKDMLEQLDAYDPPTWADARQSQAIWDYTLARARNLMRQVEADARMDTHVAQGRKILEEIDATKPIPNPPF